MKLKIKKADRGGFKQVAPQLAQIGTGPQNIPNWASNVSQGFIHNSDNLPSPTIQSPQQLAGQQGGTSDTMGNGLQINWDHALASYVAQNLASGLISKLSPNSQQNTIQQFNKQQFSPINFLPQTPNVSQQAQFGYRRGGQVKMEEGGMSEDMRQWIMSDDEQLPEPPAEETQQQEQGMDPGQYDALQFANYIQQFGLDQADGEREPEDQEEQYMFKKGGIHIKESHKGKFTAYKKRTGKTTEEALHSKDPHVRKMAQFAKNASKWHHQDGGLVEFQEGGEYNMSKQDLEYYRSMGYEIDEI